MESRWTRIEDELPPKGERVLVFGYNAPDGRNQVEVDRLNYVSKWGTPYFNSLDVVTHWAYLESIATPEDE